MSTPREDNELQESPQSRLLGAGFARSFPPFWLAPGNGGIVTEEQALAELAKGTDDEREAA